MIGHMIRDTRGVAAVEFAIVSVFLMTAILNTADVGSYVYQAMEVENAAQMAPARGMDDPLRPLSRRPRGSGQRLVTDVAISVNAQSVHGFL